MLDLSDGHQAAHSKSVHIFFPVRQALVTTSDEKGSNSWYAQQIKIRKTILAHISVRHSRKQHTENCSVKVKHKSK